MWAIDRGEGNWQEVSEPQYVTIGDVHYPPTIFTYWTDAERAAIGIYPAVITDAPPNDWSYETGRSYALTDGTVQITRTWSEPPLDDIKLDAIRRVIRRRDTVQDQNFTYGANTFDGSERTRIALLIEVIRAIYAEIHAQEYGATYPDINGVGVTLDRNGVIALVDTMATAYESVQGLALTTIATINSATDVATIQAALTSVGA